MKCHLVKAWMNMGTLKFVEFLRFFAVACGIFIYSASALASGLMRVSEEASVYARPDMDSEVLHTLVFGDEVRVSKKKQAGYRLVEFRVRGKVGRGYVAEEDIAEFDPVQAATRQTSKNSVAIKRPSYIYGAGQLSYLYQGKRDLQTTADTINEVTEFKGSANYFSFGYEYGYRPDWGIRFGVVMRESHTEGDSVVRDTTTQNRFSLRQSFTGAELGLRYAPAKWRGVSFLASVEISKSSKIDLQVLSGSPIETDDIKRSTFGVLQGAIAYDWRLKPSFMLQPFVKGGVIVTTDPVTFISEAGLALGYTFN